MCAGTPSPHWSADATESCALGLIGARGAPPSQVPVCAADPAVVLVEERQLQAEARLGVLPVGLRFEQVMPRYAVMIGDDLLVLPRAEEFFLQEHACGLAVWADSVPVV